MSTGYPKINQLRVQKSRLPQLLSPFTDFHEHLIFFQIFHVQTLFLMFSFENLRGKLARGLAKIEPFANAWFDD